MLKYCKLFNINIHITRVPVLFWRKKKLNEEIPNTGGTIQRYSMWLSYYVLIFISAPSMLTGTTAGIYVQSSLSAR